MQRHSFQTLPPTECSRSNRRQAGLSPALGQRPPTCPGHCHCPVRRNLGARHSTFRGPWSGKTQGQCQSDTPFPVCGPPRPVLVTLGDTLELPLFPLQGTATSGRKCRSHLGPCRRQATRHDGDGGLYRDGQFWEQRHLQVKPWTGRGEVGAENYIAALSYTYTAQERLEPQSDHLPSGRISILDREKLREGN